MRVTVVCLTKARHGAVLAGSLLLAAAGVVGCGATATADVSNCLAGSPVSFERSQGDPRTYHDLELTVSCSPTHPFELAEVSEGGDYPVLAVQRNGKNTCLHRQFKAKGEKCAIEIAFEPNNQPGDYGTDIYFGYGKIT